MSRLKFGLFHAPFHRPGQSPALLIEQDLQLFEHLDRLGLDEIWVGEHHSSGWEMIGAPELMVAAACQRTRQIRVGTGVNSLPYHHPFILADRWMLLDHMTRGRAMFGAGPGSLGSDAHQVGLDPLMQRPRMEEALEAIVALIESDEPVTRKTDWFELNEARLQIRPYQEHLDLRVAATVTPSGPRAAGRFGLGLLSIASTAKAGFNALEHAWGIVEERAAEFGREVDRGRWALTGPIHLAETREQARAEVRFGIGHWAEYFAATTPFEIKSDFADPDALVDEFTASEFAVIGTPDDLIAGIERLVEQSGGFGAFLGFGHDWATPAATQRSYELLARHVAPHFQGHPASRVDAADWLLANAGEFTGNFLAGQAKATAEHEAERRARES
jgi:limonene 1,2-monooxygenase